MMIIYKKQAYIEINEDEITDIQTGIVSYNDIENVEIEYKNFLFRMDKNGVIDENNIYNLEKISSCKVHYDLNGGSGDFKEQNIREGQLITRKEPTKIGYAFVGWNTKKDGSGKQYNPGTKIEKEKEFTLYAMWSATNYKILFDANDGNVEITEKNVQFNEIYGTLPTPTRTGYNFEGWYTKKDGGDLVKSSDIYNNLDTQILYAKWKVITYTVTYNSNGGSGEPQAQEKIHDQALTLSSIKPTKNEYDFKGWSTTKEGTVVNYNPGGVYQENRSIELYAIWEIQDGNYVKDKLLLRYDGKKNTKNGMNLNSMVWEDLSGNGYNSNLSNFSQNCWSGEGLIFDGVNDYLQNINVSGSQGITFEIVLKYDRTNEYRNVFDKYFATTPMLWIDPNSKLEYNATYNLGSLIDDYSDRKISITATINSNNSFLYINNNRIQYTFSGISNTDGTYQLFNRNGAQTFKGEVYELRIYKKVLSDSERTQNNQIDKVRFGI